MDTNCNPLLTIDELCEYLMIGRNTAYKILQSGELRAFRIGRIWKIPRENFTEYLQKQVITNAA